MNLTKIQNFSHSRFKILIPNTLLIKVEVINNEIFIKLEAM
jgi:hypothetical protein